MMLAEQRSIGTKLLHVYVRYYSILKDFLIACHHKTYIMSPLFLLLMSSCHFNMFCFMLDNTIMLTVCVTNIECLLIGIGLGTGGAEGASAPPPPISKVGGWSMFQPPTFG